MKKPMLAAFAFLLLATVSDAQDTPVVDVALGYSGIQVVKGFNLMGNGGSGAVALSINNWLGAVGDFGVYDAPAGGLVAGTYTFGPRFSYRHWDRLIPFAQILLGGAHDSGTNAGFTSTSNAFAFGSGGGADIGLDNGGRFALRPQLEYFGFRANGNTTNTVRFSVGIVFRIGKR